jgi:hypothetical protein
MQRRILSICCFVLSLSLLGGAAAAQSCPGYFRFVDFGISEPSGALIRGGTVFRVEVDGAIVLKDGSGLCRDVEPVFRDGRNHPIPVVDAFGYIPELVASHLTDMTVTRAWEQPENLAQENARPHRSALDMAGAQIMIGTDFLCVGPARTDTRTVSCELVNPFDRTFPLVIYCSAGACQMPVLAVDDTIILGAAWMFPEHAPIESIGKVASETVRAIHVFISENMSG